MEAGRLGRGETIAGVCAALLFLVMFLGWFGVPEVQTAVPGVSIDLGDVPGADTSISAWQAYDFTDLLLLVTIVVAVGGAIATAMARDVALPVAVSALTAGLGILSFVFVLFSVLNTPSEGPIDLDREIWVFIGVVLTAGIAYGGWMGMREEGTSFGEQADRIQDRASGPPGDGTTGGGTAGPGDSAPPPPPPPPPPSSGGTPA